MSERQLQQEIASYLDKRVAEDKFSGTVLVAKDGVPIFQQAYGLASKGYNVPNRIDPKLNLVSMNKMFTAVAIAQLAEQGKLAFDDTISQHLPDYPNQAVAEKVTIHQLLTHTSGLGNFFNDKYENMSRAKLREVRDFFPLFVDEALHFTPGAQWEYSNAGFIVLGAIVEAASGQNYFDYIREHLYQPAGMINSDCYDLDSDPPNLAIGYTREGGTLHTNTFMHVIRGGPAGGGYSTVEDLLRFANALQRHHLLNPQSTELVWTGKIDLSAEGVDKYAYGFEDIQFYGQRRVGHGGGFPGINAKLDIYLDLGYTVAVMANDDPPAAQLVADRIGKLLTGAPIPTAIQLPPEQLHAYAHSYTRTGPAEGPPRIQMVVEQNALWLVLDTERHKFLPLSTTEFFDEEFEEVRMHFALDEQGAVTAVTVENAGPETLTFTVESTQ